MSDLLTEKTQLSVDTPHVDNAATPLALPMGTPLPPPPPPSLDDAGPDRRHVLAIIGGLAILAAVAFGLLWASTLSQRDSAIGERDDAQAAVAKETDRSEAALSDLADAEADLEEAIAENAQLTADLSTAQTAAADAVEANEVAVAAAADAASAEADAADAKARAVAAEESVATLTEQNEALTAEVSELQSSLADATDPATTPATPTPFDPAEAADFARFMGEAVSSINGASVLGDVQKSCLGSAMINALGIDALGAGLSSGASAGEKSAVIDAVDAAAISCGIDPSAVL